MVVQVTGRGGSGIERATCSIRSARPASSTGASSGGPSPRSARPINSVPPSIASKLLVLRRPARNQLLEVQVVALVEQSRSRRIGERRLVLRRPAGYVGA